MTQYTNINSKLYSTIFFEGGDTLLAVYAKLKFAKRNSTKIFKENGRSIYHTLKTETNLSITTLRRYVKVLIKLNLCSIDSEGNFAMVGTTNINKLYKSKKSIRVEIGTFAQTKIFSFRVRIYTMEKSQKKAIDRKDKQINIIARQSKGYWTSKAEKHFVNICHFKGKTVEDFNAKTILSNQGYSKLKHGAERSKSSGKYWRNKLVKASIIQVKRGFQFLKRCTRSEYLRNRGYDRSIVFKNGKMFKELIPYFTTEIKVPIKQESKLAHLSFDYIYWSKAQ